MDDNLIGNILGGLINRDNDGFQNGGWWIILLMIFFWGGNGFGGWGNKGMQPPMPPQNYATQADVTNGFNFNNLQNDVRGIERGLCSNGYEMHSSLITPQLPLLGRDSASAKLSCS